MGTGFYSVIVAGKAVVDWVAKRTNEFGNFGTDIGIGLQRKLPQIRPDPEIPGYTLIDVYPRYELVAGVAYANWNGVNVECHIASDGSRRWLTRDYLHAIFTYPFVTLGVRRITVCIGEGNTDSRRFVQHLGFIMEAALADAHPTGALCIYRMYRDECKWLDLQVRHEKLAA